MTNVIFKTVIAFLVVFSVLVAAAAGEGGSLTGVAFGLGAAIVLLVVFYFADDFPDVEKKPAKKILAAR